MVVREEAAREKGGADLLCETCAGSEERNKKKRAEDGDVQQGFGGRDRKAIVGKPYALLAAVVRMAAVGPKTLCHESNLHFSAAPVAAGGSGALSRLERVLLMIGYSFNVNEKQHSSGSQEIVAVEGHVGPSGNGGNGYDPEENVLIQGDEKKVKHTPYCLVLEGWDFGAKNGPPVVLLTLPKARPVVPVLFGKVVGEAGAPGKGAGRLQKQTAVVS